MIERRRLKNVVIFIQTILSFVLSRKIKNIYVIQIGASLCYKLGQLCFITNYSKRCYKLGQLYYYNLGTVLLEIGAAITNFHNRYYKIGQLLQIGTKLLQIGTGITN